MCTFQNQIKSNRCTQCASKRDESEPVSRVQEQINALSIKDNDSELMTVNHRTSPLRTSSLYGSRTNLGAAGNRISPVDSKCYAKWPCSVSMHLIFEAAQDTNRTKVHWLCSSLVNVLCVYVCVDRCAHSRIGREA